MCLAQVLDSQIMKNLIFFHPLLSKFKKIYRTSLRARKLFDELLRVKRQQQHHHLERDTKQQRMVSDLEARERDAFAPDPAATEREEEERLFRKLAEKVSRIRPMHASKRAPTASVPKKENGRVGKESVGGAKLGRIEKT
ncbi:uncharacterized protein LOC133726555 [Rosa rugosa]|uniref:uncharacterized protein LOC133726555 n=1 Tax=Rosa rugosa TaxID=74645 RepID=UPI002B41040C|nr:uncharacterized protein LOC133726555 [Rosa rugosa]